MIQVQCPSGIYLLTLFWVFGSFIGGIRDIVFDPFLCETYSAVIGVGIHVFDIVVSDAIDNVILAIFIAIVASNNGNCYYYNKEYEGTTYLS